MDIPPDDIESERKRVIVEHYHVLCCTDVPKLQMRDVLPGNSNNTFERDFKPHFYSLFLLTCDKKELDKVIVSRVKDWFNTKHIPTDRDIVDGLTHFNDYKSELFKVNVL